MKNLTKLIGSYCQSAIYKTHLSTLNGRHIVVDVSIYMYKYEGDGTLLKSITKMLDIFRVNNIDATFIFDGKPDENKRDTIAQRRQQKDSMRQKREDLYVKADKMGDSAERERLLLEAQKMKKRCVYITYEKAAAVKALVASYNMKYIEAVGEADGICASMVNKGDAWACLSDDTDMFVHGCERVLRGFNPYNSTCLLYKTSEILSALKMTYAEFTQLCVLAGTDYNLEQKNNRQNDICYMLNLFMMYKLQIYAQANFYDWIVATKPHISIPAANVFYRIVDMFCAPLN